METNHISIRGGNHVNYIANQIIRAFEEELARLKIPSVNSSQIRNRLGLFIRCDIENPSFDSQNKENLTSKLSSFGSECVLPKLFLKKLVKESGIIDDIVQLSDAQLKAKLGKLVKNKSSKKMLNIAKLEDAHLAGTTESLDCTLILTEGDSAKALAVAGIEAVGRKYYGVLPLRGKILNVRDSTIESVSKNEELLNLAKTLGLDFNKSYSKGLNGEGLRYGHVMIMTDQDNDGSHIKGLLVNFFHHFWPNLLKIEGFLQQFITPLVKVRLPKTTTKKSSELHEYHTQSFYSNQEFEEWMKQRTGNGTKTIKEQGYQIKYYKGLGTSTAAEGIEYFRQLPKHQKLFSPIRLPLDSDKIDMAFNKKRAEDRRNWITSTFNENCKIDSTKAIVTYEEFIDKELIQFSMADNHRSIPNVLDGLKPSQRKVLYACFKRKLDYEIKVVQLAGYVAEQTAYHHGEAALHMTIIKMAQDFVCSNNVPLLVPSGQFGTRAQGGNDFASARYIFTKLHGITRYLFPVEDDSSLEHLEEVLSSDDCVLHE